MRNLYYHKEMCDVYLKISNKEYAAHRLVLCASSDVFQAMLMKPEWTEWRESKIELKELPQCENVFHLFLEYLYTGRILITHTNVIAILALADKYIVKSLTRLCLNYMSKHIPHAANHNQLFSWLQYALNCGHKEVAIMCQNYIKWNFEAVANTPDFSNFEPEIFSNLLQQNDLLIYNEMVLFNCVSRWLDLQEIRLKQLGLEQNEVDKHMLNLVESIMQSIRFTMMSPAELADLILLPLVKRYSSFFLDKMALGMAYHFGTLKGDKEIDPVQFTPRLYTCDRYSTILSIEKVRDLPSYHVSTFVFSTHMSTCESDSDKISEWTVDVYPKGVWFKKCLLIVWQGTLEVPEEIKPTVRLSLTCREPKKEDFKVRVGILLYGLQGGVQHVLQVVEKECYFNPTNKIMVVDDLLPFEELNPPTSKSHKYRSPYLIGSDQNELKINLIITPLSSL
ncbi:BTB/POZ domain-containing protein 17 isoform X2 [Agrilus planipennis]|nr:BTB/POZ domain-containing protein 17 isoform X2 [Agrilus planipennis]